MSKFMIKLSEVTRIIQGKYMTVHGDTLYIYGEDDELVGLYKLDQVVMADKT